MHELADRLRERRLGLKRGAKLEVIFDGIGLVQSATLITEGDGFSTHETRTKIV